MKSYLYDDLYQLEDTHWWHISKRKSVSSLVKKYIKTKQPEILDMGCGTGRNLEQLSDFGKTHGLDSSKNALKYCRKRGLKNLRLGNSEKTNFKNETFDLITLLDVLEHTYDQKTIKEVNRLLTKNGYLIITVPAYQLLWSRWDEVLHHKRRYTSKNLSLLLKNNHFKIIKISYLYSFLFVPALMIRSLKNLVFTKKYPSDFKLSSNILNKMLIFVADIERVFMLASSIPFGTSIICLAKKYEKI